MSIKIVFAVTEAGPDAAAGDYFTAQELGDALESLNGWRVEYRPKGEGWYELAGVDVLVVMVDGYKLRDIQNAPPHMITLAWARNWFERWCKHPWIGEYDLLLASSRLAVDYMSQSTKKPARLLRIATNTKRFNTADRPVHQTLDYVFTGSYWRSNRDIVAALSVLPSTFRGAIYGKHWEQVHQLAHLYRGFIPYEQLHGVYREAVIVIDDANHVTKEWGATNSRVFDALAAGCLVITNSRSVSDDAFAGRLPVYSCPEALGPLLDHYLNHADERVHLLNELHGKVLESHSYAHRAREFTHYLCTLQKWGNDPSVVTDPGQGPGGKEISRLASPITVLTVGPGNLHDDVSPSPTPMVVTTEDPAQRYQRLNQTLIDWPDVVARQRDSALVSIVMPVYDQPELTLACLESLYWHTPVECFELILVDNGSAAITRQLLEAWVIRYPNVYLARQEENLGFALGCNMGFAASQGAKVVFLNNDTLLTPHWLPPLVAPLDIPDIAAVQPRLLFPDGRVQCLGVVFSSYNPIGYSLYAGLFPAVPWAERDRALQAVTGASLAVRAGDFARLGGFDPVFINGQEDVDLCLRLRREGLGQAWCAAGSTVYHHEGRSQGRGNHITRNRSLFYRRWVGKVRPDDRAHYQADGFVVTAYQPESSQPPRPRHLQIFRPVFERGSGGARDETPEMLAGGLN